MSQVADIQTIETLKKKSDTTFELVKHSNSQWVKKGQEGSNNPTRLQAPKDLFVPLQSRVWDGSRYLETQYVIGAPTIYLNDRTIVNEKGEPVITIEKGLRSLGYNLKEELYRANNLHIRFIFGKLFLDKFGEDPTLLEFIQKHEDNEERPFNDKRDPRKMTLFVFKPLRKEAKSASRISNMDVEIEAMEYIGKLRKKVDGGYKYNTEMIEVLLNIFEAGANLDADDMNQKMELIYRMAKHDGPTFMRVINESLDGYRMAIGKSTKFKVLTLTSKEASITVDNKKRTLLAFTSGNEAENIDKLTYYFINSKQGQNDYAELNSQVQIALIASQKES